MFKRKKNEKGEELENAWDVFVRNYRMVPGFRAIVKLAVYILLIIIFITVLSLSTADNNEEKDKTTTTSTTVLTTKAIVYNDILEALKRDNLNIYSSVIIGKDTYVIDVINKQNILSGYLESKEGTTKIKVENGKNYEVVLNEQKENENLFGSIDRDFIVPADMVSLLTSNYATKLVEEDVQVYNYDIKKNNIHYEIKVYIKNNNCYKIEINSDNSNYLITYK